jgi:hypothetical protein
VKLKKGISESALFRAVDDNDLLGAEKLLTSGKDPNHIEGPESAAKGLVSAFANTH